jgi:hypothetical protein
MQKPHTELIKHDRDEYGLMPRPISILLAEEYMSTRASPSIADRTYLDDLLIHAVILGWSDMVSEKPLGAIHIEYHVDRFGAVEFLTIWASTISEDLELVCEHWNTYHSRGVFFSSSFRSAQLDETLDLIMKYQKELVFRIPPGGNCRIQVKAPTRAEIVMAKNAILLFRHRVARESSSRLP